MTIMSLSACANPFAGNGSGGESGAASAPERVDTGFVLTNPGSFDSADTAILVDRDEKESTVTFLNLDLGKRYTLSLDVTTGLYDTERIVISEGLSSTDLLITTWSAQLREGVDVSIAEPAAKE